MTAPASELPFGLRDLCVKSISSAGTLGTLQDFPNAQVLEFEEAEDFETLRGDDGIIAIRGKGPFVNWTLHEGGISLAAYNVIVGGTVTLTGTTPAQQHKVTKKGTDIRPYFKTEGQSIPDGGGDFHAVLYRCRASGTVKGTMGDGVFWVTEISGMALPDPNNSATLYDLIWNETAIALI
jgi:hypothetical protein